MSEASRDELRRFKTMPWPATGCASGTSAVPERASVAVATWKAVFCRHCEMSSGDWQARPNRPWMPMPWLSLLSGCVLVCLLHLSPATQTCSRVIRLIQHSVDTGAPAVCQGIGFDRGRTYNGTSDRRLFNEWPRLDPCSSPVVLRRSLVGPEMLSWLA